MPSKLSLQTVTLIVEKFDCKLLSKTYDGPNNKYEFECSCGEHFETTFANFHGHKKNKCNKCIPPKRIQKHSIEFVSQTFEKEGCKLLSETYENNKRQLKCICKCGRLWEVSFDSFKNKSQRCRLCHFENCKGLYLMKYEDIKKIFDDRGLILLTKIYTGAEQKLEYICICGNIAYSIYSNIKKNHLCSQCGNKRIGKKRAHSYDYIKKQFELKGCKLLSKTYVNNNEPLDYVCKCGNISTIRYAYLRTNGLCGCQKPQGEIKITTILTNLGLEFLQQYHYDDLRIKRYLRFDFFVKYKGIHFLLEFDGGQHFRSIKWFGGDDGYQKRKNNDTMKNAYCIKNNIYLLRISYKEINKIKDIIDEYLIILDNNDTKCITFSNKNIYQEMTSLILDTRYAFI